MSQQVFPVILSGGSGTRLWPLSRKHYPKQFHKLTGGEHTLLQETALRVKHLAAPIIVCNDDHRFMLAEQLHSIGIKPAAILLEPEAKNTAPAIALAALQAQQLDAQAIIAVFPADHVIRDQHAFEQALQTAVNSAATSDDLITFGIVPTHPETGYGYIETGSAGDAGIVPSDTPTATAVLRFTEKPDIATAQSYLNSGKHLWNSGMFVFKAAAYLSALQQSQPQMLACCQQAFSLAKKDLDFVRVDKDSFAQCPADSIDYAVLEKAGDTGTHKVRVVPMAAGWSDIGSWRAIWEILDKTKDGTACLGDVISLNSNNCLVHNTSKDKLVVTIGLDDVVVVDTKNALLVAHKDQVQDVKKVVEQIANTARDEHLYHREVHRPWGSYDSVDFGDRYQVKRIRVKPGASLSLQMHHHRAEHWVVVSGTAKVKVGEKETILAENQSVYIPLGEVHRLTNPGKVALELIEVQSGSYLGEDDIVRFEDTFGRI